MVGLNTAVLVARRSPHRVTVIDINERVVESINSGNFLNFNRAWRPFAGELSRIKATTSYDAVDDADLVMIAVNTPVKLVGDELIGVLLRRSTDIDELIDLKPLEMAIEEISDRARRGSTVLVETTIYPGGTRERVISRLEARGYEVGRDLYVAHVPERIDPGNSSWDVADIPRVLGSPDRESRRKALRFLIEELGLDVHLTRSLEAAEMSKLYENTFRLVNIAFAQELLMTGEVPPLDVISAVRTKPFGMKVFYPGPYAGGTCLVKDSLMYFAVTGSEIVRRALIINELAPRFYATRIASIVRRNNIRKIVFLGSGYKPGVRYEGDPRLNPVFRIIRELGTFTGVEISVLSDEDPLPPGEKTLVIPWNYRTLLEIVSSMGGRRVGGDLLWNSPLRTNLSKAGQDR